MKKDDIIKQKLFETCNLSNFYLDYIIKCKWEDESPMHLANCYKQKLYEIADKYDRMMEASRQREQLYLSLEKSARFGKNFHANIAARTSTPNKSKSNCSSHATTPTTPINGRGFIRSSSTSSNIGRVHKHGRSTSKKLNDLEQRIHSIYYDEFDEDDIEDEYRCEPRTGDLFNEDEYEIDYQEDLDPAITNLNQNIEKSYSNLSKDSGVLIDSYHSDYSNFVYSPQSDDRAKNNTVDTTHIEHDLNSVSPSSNEDDEEVKINEEERDQIAPILGQNISLKKIFNSKMESRRLNGSSQAPGYSLFNSKFYQDQYKTYTKNLLTKKLSNISKKNANFNLELDSTNLMSLVVDHQNSVIPNEENESNLSLCSTPSPSSTSSTEINEYEFNYKNNPSLNSSSSINSLSQPTTNSLIKSNNPLFFNYNSLMNVSMLDSIQIANNNLETDMSSSILMFN